jgi:hypothetical protein
MSKFEKTENVKEQNIKKEEEPFKCFEVDRDHKGDCKTVVRNKNLDYF